MVEGYFRCFGTAQHLKDKFGHGYEIRLKIDMHRLADLKPDFEMKKTYTDHNLIGKVLDELEEKGIGLSEFANNWTLNSEYSESGLLKKFW